MYLELINLPELFGIPICNDEMVLGDAARRTSICAE
jgi:hypothetical protein